MPYYAVIPFSSEYVANLEKRDRTNAFVEKKADTHFNTVVGPYDTEQLAYDFPRTLDYTFTVEERKEEDMHDEFNWSADKEYTVNNWPSEFTAEFDDYVGYKWGYSLSSASLFRKTTGEMVWSTGGVMHPLVPKPKFEERYIYSLEYTELESLNSRFLKQESERSYFGYNTFELNLMDSRGYKYCVQFGTSSPTTYLLNITAGCQSWFSFEEARNHYDENYDSDGNRHEVLKMLEVLEGWYTAICADKKPKPTLCNKTKPTLWELVKEKAPSYNWDEPFLVSLSTRVEEKGSDSLRIVYDKNDDFQKMALGFGSKERARWLTKEMATNLRDMLSEAIDDWGKIDDDDIPF